VKEAAPSILDMNPDRDVARRALDFEEKLIHMQNAFVAIERCRLPVIVGVTGGCIGAGIDMITACDIVYTTKDSFFSVKEVDVAMVADLGTLQRLPILASNWSLMKEYCLTGERFSAAEAQRLGIVSRVFDTEQELHKNLFKVAQQIASKSPIAVVGIKHTINTPKNRIVDQGLREVARTNMSQIMTNDVMDAVTASFQKKNASYQKL